MLNSSGQFLAEALRLLKRYRQNETTQVLSLLESLTADVTIGNEQMRLTVRRGKFRFNRAPKGKRSDIEARITLPAVFEMADGARTLLDLLDAREADLRGSARWLAQVHRASAILVEIGARCPPLTRLFERYRAWAKRTVVENSSAQPEQLLIPTSVQKMKTAPVTGFPTSRSVDK